MRIRFENIRYIQLISYLTENRRLTAFEILWVFIQRKTYYLWQPMLNPLITNHFLLESVTRHRFVPIRLVPDHLLILHFQQTFIWLLSYIHNNKIYLFENNSSTLKNMIDQKQLDSVKKVKGHFYGAFSTLRPFGLLYSYLQQVPAFISRGATHHTDARELYQRRRELLPMNFASESVIHENPPGSFTCHKAGTWDIILLPLRRKVYWGFSGCPKNPTASAGFETANSGYQWPVC